jgi:hypothetical protein
MTDQMTKEQAEKVAERILHFEGKSTPQRLAKAKKRIIAVGEKLGMKFSKSDPKKSFNWTGETANIGRLAVSNIIHEVAHYMVATSANRNMPDFGLGAGIESGVYTPPLYHDSVDQEVLASYLGIMWERHLGLDIVPTLIDHSWVHRISPRVYDQSDTPASKIVQKLNAFGLVDKHGRLRVRVRT